MTDAAKQYPGELASPRQLYELAEEYRKAAHFLLQLRQSRKPLTSAPFRLSAIQAIELYLNALLLQHGYLPGQLRGLQHDLWARTEFAISKGLRLRIRTVDHLQLLSQSREYLVTRYSPELVATASQINRLTATLEEVAEKISAQLSKPKAPSLHPNVLSKEKS